MPTYCQMLRERLIVDRYIEAVDETHFWDHAAVTMTCADSWAQPAPVTVANDQ